MANNANEFENDPQGDGEQIQQDPSSLSNTPTAHSQEPVSGQHKTEKVDFERRSAYQSPENAPPRWPANSSTHSSAQSSPQQNQWYEPPVTPPSFWTALLLLPGHCLRAITQPATQTFVYLKRYANWGMVWVLLAISVVLSFRLVSASLDVGGNTAAPIQIPWPVQLLIAPLGFFLFAWIQFTVGRSFSKEKQARFVEHCYTMQLAIIPLSLIEAIFSYFPAFYSAASFVFGLYTVILNVLAFKAVHSINAWRATLTYLAPLIPLLFIFACTLCSLSMGR